MEFARDLGSADLWADSLERSLARRGRPRRTSLALARLTAERDLTDGETLGDSLAYWRARRAASASSSFNVPALGGASVLALLAATTLPSLAGDSSHAARRTSLRSPAGGTGLGRARFTLPAFAVLNARGAPGGIPTRHATEGRATPTHAAAAHAAAAYALTASTSRTVTHVLSLGGTDARTISARATDTHVLATGPTDTHVLAAAPTNTHVLFTGAASAPATASPTDSTSSAPAPAPATAVSAVTTPAASPTSAAAAAPAPHRYGKIAYGDIRDAQRMLGVGIDGILGPKTGSAIRAFQTSHGLAVDGIVGPVTWSAMASAEHAAQRAAHRAVFAHAVTVVREEATFQPAVTQTTTSGVSALQDKLGISADGTFGEATLAAVQSFQSAHGLDADGVVGPATRDALGLGAGPVLSATGGTAAADTPAPASTPAATTPATTEATTPVTTEATTEATTQATTPASTDTTGAASTPSTTTSSSTDTSSIQTALSEMIAAGDQIATLPYIYGGGHGSFVAPGYDCSGSVSYVLHAAGLLSAPEDSTGLESFGAPGPGQYVTIYANAGHAWMTIEGRRFDTVALQESGSRWGSGGGEYDGYIVRHPVGF